MNRTKPIKILVSILCLLVVITAGVLAGCQPKITVPMTLDEFSLTDLWEKTVAITDVQEISAQLDSFWLRVEADGSTRVQYLTFYGQNEKGRPTLYLVNTNTEGELRYDAFEQNFSMTTRHPLDVFTEIDKLGLPLIPQGDDGCGLRVGFEDGSYSGHYSDDIVTICELNDGELLPLEEINFASGLPWATITVSPMYIVEEGVDEDGHSFKHSSTNVDGQSMEQLWFLAADMSKAESVEYLVN